MIARGTRNKESGMMEFFLSELDEQTFIAKGDQMDALIIADDSVELGDKFVIPRGMTYATACKILERKHEEEETETQFSRQFNYRPWDGAVANWNVLKKTFGVTLGKGIQTLFGERPPEMRTIEIGPEKSVQVPWGQIEIPTLEGATLMTHGIGNEDYGDVFFLAITAKRKYRDAVEKFFDDVQAELESNSIYRGKAVIGYNNPKFIDLAAFNPESVVYSEEVLQQLESTLWAPINFTQEMRRENIPRRRTVLLYGPYGTGKTLAGQLTAQTANKNGWTFIGARPGQDNLENVLRMARMYEPAVIFFEDVDVVADTTDKDAVTELLEAFDGITAKGAGELVAVLTTNHIERIHKGMLRPGRFDALVEINALDQGGVEKLVMTTAKKLADDVDFDAVWVAMQGFLPAFITETIHRASAVALARSNGEAGWELTTHDLEIAAAGLRPQLELMEQALEGQPKPELEQALQEQIRKGLDKTKVVDYDEDEMYTLQAVN